ncbi:WYL domain-containing protein [Marinigracilibium pacificum]|uniref:WYL domain-containing protein n=1 Tax=Marinigracilibium pacificum TaxID=2729599 RepID=A0A848J606_9BACT|nr:WYL domain-containing protein [Marinigracilibium pacificum]NMM49950.1 WYL domain-containing protein [Marinigracilibium pacificum]
MPVTRNALIRYKTIDNCLRNRQKRWTLDDLINVCSEALYEFEGIDKGVSRRTVQMDIQMMRSEKLGYNAPIIVVDRKYYTYKDPEYSITNIPLTDKDLNKLTEVTNILKQFKGFSHFKELSGMVQKLEDKIHVSKTNEHPIIDLEKNENLKGLEYIDPVYKAILNKKSLSLEYQSFKARKANTFKFHPALLKEFRNRWFVLGKRNQNSGYVLLALDRINSLEIGETSCINFDQNEIANYFKHVIGVSTGGILQEVILLVDHSNAPYVLTKPIHHSQEVINISDEGVTIKLNVQLNFELEREILGFGDRMKVISPPRLRSIIKQRLNHAIDLYTTELNEQKLHNYKPRLEHKGSIITNYVFSRKEIGQIGRIIQYYQNTKTPKLKNIDNLIDEIPDLTKIILNFNLKRIIESISEKWEICNTYLNLKPETTTDKIKWHQDQIIYKYEDAIDKIFTIFIHLDEVNIENGCLSIIQGSHKQVHTKEKIEIISSSSIPSNCEVNAGGIQIVKSGIIRRYNSSEINRIRRTIRIDIKEVDD